MLIAAADVGSVDKDRFAWFATDAAGNRRGAELNAHDPVDLAQCIKAALVAGESVALGFECPLALPVPVGAADLGRQRLNEGRHTWSSGGGAAALASGTVQLSWVLRAVGPRTRVTVRPERWPDRAPLLLWEAFVAGAYKPKLRADEDAKDVHRADAEAAVVGFRKLGLPLPTAGRISIDPTSGVLNIAAAAALTHGLTIDVDELSAPILIVDGDPDRGHPPTTNPAPS